MMTVLLLLKPWSDWSWSYLLAGFKLRASVIRSDHEIIDKFLLLSSHSTDMFHIATGSE